ncbi:MAG TPA: DUF6766 family protein [Mycobacteriales bacterium]|nr:DUF6766 family protein [Mycobacteriales bacterium]
MSARMVRAVRDNSLTLVFLVLFAGALVGQSFVGQADFNAGQRADDAQPVSWATYVRSSDFAVNVAENWQSEYLQFALYIMGTIWLIQRGSSESKSAAGTMSEESQRLGRYATTGSPRWVRAGGYRAWIYGRSLGSVMALFFAGSWLAQSIAGRAAYNAQRIGQYEDPVGWGRYVRTAEFWDRTLQNWQSELLAVASMGIFAVYLRQRGSPESKPVGAAHDTTDSND